MQSPGDFCQESSPSRPSPCFLNNVLLDFRLLIIFSFSSQVINSRGQTAARARKATELKSGFAQCWRLKTLVLHTPHKSKSNNFRVKVCSLLWSENNLSQMPCFRSSRIRILNLFAIYIPQGHEKWIKALFYFHGFQALTGVHSRKKNNFWTSGKPVCLVFA